MDVASSCVLLIGDLLYFLAKNHTITSFTCERKMFFFDREANADRPQQLTQGILIIYLR